MKTSFATKLGDMLTYAVISKDNIRSMMFVGRHYTSMKLDDLKAVESVRDAMLLDLLKQGRSVILDETFIEIDDIERAFAIIPEGVHKAIFDLTWVPLEWSFRLDEGREQPRGFETLLNARERLERNPLTRLSEPFVYDFCGDNEAMKYAVEELYHEIQTRRDRNEGVSIPQGPRVSY